MDSKKTISFKLTTAVTTSSVGLAGATELCIEYVGHKNRTAGHDHAGRKPKENGKSGTALRDSHTATSTAADGTWKCRRLPTIAMP